MKTWAEFVYSSEQVIFISIDSFCDELPAVIFQ